MLDCVGGIGAGTFGGYDYDTNSDIHGAGSGGDINATCILNGNNQWYF